MESIVRATELLLAFQILRRGSLAKAISDIASAVTPPIGQSWDYSHVLTPEQRRQGYSMELRSHANGDYIGVSLRHGGYEVGSVVGLKNRDGSIEPHADPMDQEHRGRGLGRAMYEALYTHASKRHGVSEVAGNVHSEAASRVHQSLSRRHGMSYRPVLRDVPSKDYPNAPYRYKIT